MRRSTTLALAAAMVIGVAGQASAVGTSQDAWSSIHRATVALPGVEDATAATRAASLLSRARDKLADQERHQSVRLAERAHAIIQAHSAGG